MLKGKIIHGFEFISSRPLPELSATLHEARYVKNGAELVFLEREDDNKTFAIAFKTIPEDDTGVFHILEHSVLCGSRKYPVKEPFVELLKSSLKTFLNAFTFPDKTMYPVASRNNRDFLNLIDIYMDAVLHPTAITRPEIFMQEGWHYELPSVDGELTYKGVVFNEMKGAYSSADEVETQKMTTLLYKNTCYAKDSGGNPEFIPTLTYEKFVAAHAKYYHPSNAKIFLDGSVELDETLAKLDSFLSEYGRLDESFDIPRIKHSGHTEDTVEYEISESEDGERRARVCLGFATSDFEDRRTTTALSLISDAIAGSNDAPFKKAILDTGICEDVSFISYDGIQENSVFIELKNLRAEDMDTAERMVTEELRKIAERGIDRGALLAALNSTDFRVREQDTATFPTGILYAISALDTWLYGGDPLAALAFEDDMRFLREALDTDYYEKLIERVFLASPHSATLRMLPSATLGNERSEREREKLRAYRESLTEDQLSGIADSTAHILDWQATPDSEEALATIPHLSISDISEMPAPYPTVEYDLLGVPALFTETASKGITYTTLLFDISDFTESELITASLLTDILKNVPTKNYSTHELQTKIKTELGALTASVISAAKGSGEGKTVHVYFRIGISALNTSQDKIPEILSEVLLGSDFADRDAITKIIKQLKSSSAESIVASGHSVAFARCAAYVNREAAVSEYIDGIEFYRELKALDAEIGTRADSLTCELSRICKQIFTKSRLTVSHAGARNDSYISTVIDIFPIGEYTPKASLIEPLGVRREGIQIPAAIAFLSSAASMDDMPGSADVVRTALSYGYLWNTVRVQGGAYGAGFIKRRNGTCGYYTYRDPDPARSLCCFLGSADFLRELAASGEDLTQYIIGAVGDADPLITPKVLSALSVVAYLCGETHGDRVRRRRELLGTSPSDLIRFADALDAAFANSGICVVGGKDKLASLSDKIDTVIEI